MCVCRRRRTFVPQPAVSRTLKTATIKQIMMTYCARFSRPPRARSSTVSSDRIVDPRAPRVHDACTAPTRARPRSTGRLVVPQYSPPATASLVRRCACNIACACIINDTSVYSVYTYARVLYVHTVQTPRRDNERARSSCAPPPAHHHTSNFGALRQCFPSSFNLGTFTGP